MKKIKYLFRCIKRLDVKNMFVDHHVYFMKEDGRYIDKMIHAILTSGIV